MSNILKKYLLSGLLVTTAALLSVDNKVDQVGALNTYLEVNSYICVGIGNDISCTQGQNSSTGSKSGPSINAIGDQMAIPVSNPIIIRSLNDIVLFQLPKNRGTFVYQITPTTGEDAGKRVLIAFHNDGSTISGKLNRRVSVSLNVDGETNNGLRTFTEIGQIFINKSMKNSSIAFNVSDDGKAETKIGKKGKVMTFEFNSKGLEIAEVARQNTLTGLEKDFGAA